MAYPEIKIVDCTTNEVVVREMTKEENDQRIQDETEAKTRATFFANKAASKQAVLDKLGLTADEVSALLS